jgi:hypothetical protein
MVKNELRKFSQWFRKGFWNGLTEREKMESYKKRIFKVEVFFSSQNIDFPFYLKTFGDFFLFSSFFQYFFFLFFSPFFLCPVSWGLGGFDDIRWEKSLLQKLLFKWNVMDWLSLNIGGGCIFQNAVMHANMAKPWSWRWGSCGYNGSRCIFRSGGMHADIFNS